MKRYTYTYCATGNPITVSLLCSQSPGAYCSHIKNSNAKKNIVSIQQHFKKRPGLGHQEKVAKAELLISGFMSEHNMQFSQADHLKRAFNDSDIAKDVSLRKTKASYVIQDGIAWDEQQNNS